ncbi:hypothetical protein SETIT_5G432800v2 [Setaria italica]|uniref:Uncharacterized protein n=1 Tax=Setaria italica TaxID=4555 RepID=A0A368RF24_SETIT|nr:hypothetical protein SETIT_5G432800v2 [Setaria italica]
MSEPIGEQIRPRVSSLHGSAASLPKNPEERVETAPAKPKSRARPATHGMRRRPMANVTEPQSMSAIDAPRSMAAAAAGDIPGAGRPSAAGEGETIVRSSAQSSRIIREYCSPQPSPPAVPVMFLDGEARILTRASASSDRSIERVGGRKRNRRRRRDAERGRRGKQEEEQNRVNAAAAFLSSIWPSVDVTTPPAEGDQLRAHPRKTHRLDRVQGQRVAAGARGGRGPTPPVAAGTCAPEKRPRPRNGARTPRRAPYPWPFRVPTQGSAAGHGTHRTAHRITASRERPAVHKQRGGTWCQPPGDKWDGEGLCHRRSRRRYRGRVAKHQLIDLLRRLRRELPLPGGGGDLSPAERDTGARLSPRRTARVRGVPIYGAASPSRSALARCSVPRRHRTAVMDQGVNQARVGKQNVVAGHRHSFFLQLYGEVQRQVYMRFFPNLSHPNTSQLV